MLVNGITMNETNDKRVFRDNNGNYYGIKYVDFWQYVDSNGLKRNDIKFLSPENKRKFFLKWKHGLNDPRANEDIEGTKKYIRQLTGELTDFDKYCEQIEEEIGLKLKPGQTITNAEAMKKWQI